MAVCTSIPLIPFTTKAVSEPSLQKWTKCAIGLLKHAFRSSKWSWLWCCDSLELTLNLWHWLWHWLTHSDCDSFCSWLWLCSRLILWSILWLSLEQTVTFFGEDRDSLWSRVCLCTTDFSSLWNTLWLSRADCYTVCDTLSGAHLTLWLSVALSETHYDCPWIYWYVGAACRFVATLHDWDPDVLCIKPHFSHNKICTAVGPLSKALNPVLFINREHCSSYIMSEYSK